MPYLMCEVSNYPLCPLGKSRAPLIRGRAGGSLNFYRYAGATGVACPSFSLRRISANSFLPEVPILIACALEPLFERNLNAPSR